MKILCHLEKMLGQAGIQSPKTIKGQEVELPVPHQQPEEGEKQPSKNNVIDFFYTCSCAQSTLLVLYLQVLYLYNVTFR